METKIPKYVQTAADKMENYMDKAREQRFIIEDWLENNGIDTKEYAELIENECDYVYGVDLQKMVSLLESQGS